MSGSRLGRGRGARLAVYVGCGVVLLLLGFFYRAATSEMARLRELHVQCAHQQEALAAQLQVIFEYKVRLEKSLAEEKTSNTAVKQELQQRASREKSLRDKDSIEAMQRYNSLQQTYKILNTEHKDFQEECKKREKQALEDTSRLESTLQDLRSRIKQAREDKEKSMEHLKNKYLELENEKNKQEERYNQMMQNHANVEEANLHRDKEVFQLKHELEEAKKFCKGVFPSSSLASPQSVQVKPQTHDKSVGAQSGIEGSNHRHHQQHQQVSRPSSDDVDPQPLGAPRSHHAIGDALSEERLQEGALPNDQPSDVAFAQKNGRIVPVAPDEDRDGKDEQRQLPLPYQFREKHHEDLEAEHRAANHANDHEAKVVEEKLDGEEEQHKQVLVPPKQDDDPLKAIGEKSSSKSPKNNVPVLKPPSADIPPRDEDGQDAEKHRGDDELQALQDKVEGILNHLEQ